MDREQTDIELEPSMAKDSARVIDREVRAFYLGQSMPAELAEETLARARAKYRLRRRRLVAAIAAALILLSSAIWLRSHFATRALVDRASAELVLNHRKNLEMDVAASDWRLLAAAMDKLPFELSAPRAPNLEGYELLGGRYCSIQAQLAAQLKVRQRESGRVATLYVTELSPELADLAGAQRNLDSLEIQMWTEGQLLFAMAEETAIAANPL